MKKSLAVAAVVLGLVGAAFAITYTNQGVVVSVDVLSEHAATPGLARSVIPCQGWQVSTAAEATVSTHFTPRDMGDVLFAPMHATGGVWVAMGVSTTSWKRITLE